MSERSERILSRTEEVLREEDATSDNYEERASRIASAVLYALSDLMVDANEDGEEWPDWSQVHSLAAEVELPALLNADE